MTKKYNEKSIQNLVKAFVCIDSEEECLNFLADLCTVSEIKAMAQRLEVASLLKNKTVYNDIVSKTGASTATISRVNNALSYGEEGYTAILEKLQKKTEAE